MLASLILLHKLHSDESGPGSPLWSQGGWVKSPPRLLQTFWFWSSQFLWTHMARVLPSIPATSHPVTCLPYQPEAWLRQESFLSFPNTRPLLHTYNQTTHLKTTSLRPAANAGQTHSLLYLSLFPRWSHLWLRTSRHSSLPPLAPASIFPHSVLPLTTHAPLILHLSTDMSRTFLAMALVLICTLSLLAWERLKVGVV